MAGSIFQSVVFVFSCLSFSKRKNKGVISRGENFLQEKYSTTSQAERSTTVCELWCSLKGVQSREIKTVNKAGGRFGTWIKILSQTENVL